MTEAELILCEMLVLRCQRGDKSAAGELVELFEKPVIYYLRRLVGSEEEAWDLLQEAWMGVFRALPRMRDGRALPAFVYRTARHCGLAHLRKRAADGRLLEAAESELGRGAEGEEAEEGFTAEDAAAVHAGLAKLSLAHREVLTLHFLGDLSLEEMAGVLEVPCGTVKSRMHHAKKALAVIMQGESHGA